MRLCAQRVEIFPLTPCPHVLKKQFNCDKNTGDLPEIVVWLRPINDSQDCQMVELVDTVTWNAEGLFKISHDYWK